MPAGSNTSATAAHCGSHTGDAYAQAVLADAPIAYYRLDEAAGPMMCDTSVAHHPGTYSAGVRFGVSGAVAGDAAVAAGSPSAGIGTGGSDAGITGNHDFTFEAWYRSTSGPHSQSLVNTGQAGQGTIAGLSTWTSTTGDGKASQLVLDLYVGVANAATLPIWDTSTVGVNLWDGAWHALAITYNSGADAVTGYVDGHDLGSKTPIVAINLASSGIRVGSWVDDYLNPDVIGELDEVAVYPSALSATRIEAHVVAAGRSVAPSATSTPPSGGTSVAIGTNNPGQGDCNTNTDETASSVGSAVLSVTAGSFRADIELAHGQPTTTYGVFLQQVPGSCPQPAANGGTLTTDSTGSGTATATVPRAAGATTFFVQLVPVGSQGPQYTSDRISGH